MHKHMLRQDAKAEQPLYGLFTLGSMCWAVIGGRAALMSDRIKWCSRSASASAQLICTPLLCRGRANRMWAIKWRVRIISTAGEKWRTSVKYSTAAQPLCYCQLHADIEGYFYRLLLLLLLLICPHMGPFRLRGICHYSPFFYLLTVKIHFDKVLKKKSAEHLNSSNITEPVLFGRRIFIIADVMQRN